MSDFDPVEIRLDLIQNVDSEGEKSTAAINDIAAASNKMKAQFEKDIIAQKTMITQLINELKILKETMAKKVDSGDEKQAIDKQKLIEQIDILNKKLIEQQRILEKLRTTPTGPASKTLPGLPADPAAYAKGVNTLNFSMQQIARELPNFAISPMIGIMSLSNNLPILQDSLNKMIAVNKALKESGQATIPVWKQITSSLFSMQTALIAGITVMMLYGKEIGTWVSDLFKSKDALSQLKRAQEELRLSTIDGQKSAQGEISRLELLYETTTDVTKSINERNAAVDELQKTYPDYFRNIDDETLKTGNAADAYDKLRKSIIDAAIAKAYEKKITENQTKIIDLEAQKALKVAEFNKQIASSSVVSKTPGGSQIRFGFGVAKASFSQSDIDDLNKEIETLTAQIEEYSKKINITDLLFGGKQGKGGKDSGAKVLGIYDELVQKIHDTGKAILNSTEAERPALQERLRLLLAQRDAWEAIIKAQRGETSELKNVPVIKANVATAPVDTKTLGTMKQLTAEQRKQLEIMAKAATLEALKNDPEKLEREARLREDIVRSAVQLVDALTEGADLTEEQANALSGLMSVVSAIGRGDYVGAAISGISQIITQTISAFSFETTDKVQSLIEKIKELSADLKESIDDLETLRLSIKNLTGSISSVGFNALLMDLKEVANAAAEVNEKFAEIPSNTRRITESTYTESSSGRTGTGGRKGNSSALDFYELESEIKRLQAILATGQVSNSEREQIIELLKLYNDTMDGIDAIIQDVAGTSISALSNSFIDAFLVGENAAEQWGEKVDDIVKNVIKNQLVSKMLTQPISSAINSLVRDTEDGLTADEANKFKDTMSSVYATVTPALRAAIDALKTKGIDLGNVGSTRTGSAKGIAQASQDSVDELNGRMTAIQAYIYDIRNMNQQSFDFEKEALAYDDAILSQLEAIAENTDYCKLLVDVKRVLEDIQLKGVKIKN